MTASRYAGVTVVGLASPQLSVQPTATPRPGRQLLADAKSIVMASQNKEMRRRTVTGNEKNGSWQCAGACRTRPHQPLGPSGVRAALPISQPPSGGSGIYK